MALVDGLKSFKFDIDSTILDYYKIIKSWSESEIREQFLINAGLVSVFDNAWKVIERRLLPKVKSRL